MRLSDGYAEVNQNKVDWYYSKGALNVWVTVNILKNGSYSSAIISEWEDFNHMYDANKK